MKNHFVKDGMYQLGPYHEIFDLNTKELTCALQARREEYKTNGYGECVYSEDPIFVQPELYMTLNEAKEQRLITDPKEILDGEYIATLIWSDMSTRHIFCCPADNVEFVSVMPAM